MRFSIYLSAFLLACSPLAFVHPARVEGNSMEPTLKNGRVLLVLWPWCSGQPRLGEVWTFDGPEGRVIKRVLALPGQALEQRNGYLLREGQYVEEPHVSLRELRDGGPWTSGDGYLLLGDNRPASRDCRLWGSIGRNSMKGRVVAGGG